MLKKKSDQQLLLFLTLACLVLTLVFLTSSETEPSNTLPLSKSIASANLEINQQSKTFKGVTLVPVVGTAEVLLYDMQGNLLHKWPVDAERARLLPNGHLLNVAGSKWGHDKSPWQEVSHKIQEFDWNGNLVWEYSAKDILHHDFQKLKNGNLLLLQRSFVPEELKKNIEDKERAEKEIRSDAVFEITPDGEIVYSYFTHDHLDLNHCGVRPCAAFEFEESDQFLDWTHVNTATVLPENKWYRQGDQRFKPGNLLILPRNWWSVLIIDRDTKQTVWSYRGSYRGGISGGHEAQMIPEGMPGAGNILVLDNGTKTHPGESIVLEINPVDNKVAWAYEAGRSFFTKSRGAAQRLANGNTLISEDRTGRIFEVNSQKEIVWSLQMDYPTNRAKRYPLSYIENFLQ